MKLIIAHLPPDAWESAQSDLLSLGVLRMTISQIHSSGPQSAMTLHARGAALHTHLRPELRLECVAETDQAPGVVDVLCAHANTRWGGGRVAVLELEELHDGASRQDSFPDDALITAY